MLGAILFHFNWKDFSKLNTVMTYHDDFSRYFTRIKHFIQ